MQRIDPDEIAGRLDLDAVIARIDLLRLVHEVLDEIRSIHPNQGIHRERLQRMQWKRSVMRRLVQIG